MILKVRSPMNPKKDLNLKWYIYVILFKATYTKMYIRILRIKKQ